MFIALYEFKIKPGTLAEFREAWLEVTKAIYKHCGSFGSRLHTTESPDVLMGYAQWPSREHWAKDHALSDEHYDLFRQKMRECLIESKTVYEMEVSDDYLQSSPSQP
ncbi:antibiotic biosynthesis monooxygenase [Marinobacterium sp. AK62]|uniref:Antibiotic biosynthesis monooxygenase n=1 Tax=Marinobacterium alkalitolerans TaxID=1542925 RepID=A0ABS3Z8C1_9GAMM|nr:antibiotic biosynthesis monooxygenase [Marinobacterium alkalitolerans]MBP0047943.1 antibiotic biosynthesis monooxygenase [Marinobacterium alkalitolerans]